MLLGGLGCRTLRRLSFAVAVAVPTLVGAAPALASAPADVAAGTGASVPVSVPAQAAVGSGPVVGVLPRVLLAAALVGLVLAARARHQRGTVAA